MRSEESAEAVVAAVESSEGPNEKEDEAAVELESARHQKTSEQLELPFRGKGEARPAERSGEARPAVYGDERPGGDRLMEEVVARSNLEAAYRRVKSNKGSPGVDGMTVEELGGYLARNWEDLRRELLQGDYRPRPIRKQEIPKDGGGVRELGIPCAVDRLIQQAILQVLQRRLDATFSDHSYGFRPGRRAHDAVCAAQRYIQAGKTWVVDVDLEKFFDRVNHDVLMGRLSFRISDKRLLGLIRRYLEAGIMSNGVVMERWEGTPQGGPLSPLLANVLLDEVDQELMRRGHAFARYADDCNAYVGSERAGEELMETLRGLYAKLKLKVNETKSAVGRPWERQFLGYSFYADRQGAMKRKVAPKALVKLKKTVRKLTGRNIGRSLPQVIERLREYLRGWREYFKLAETKQDFLRLDKWIRHRLRTLRLKQLKNRRTVFRRLLAVGVSHKLASQATAHMESWWRTAGHPALHVALPNCYFDKLGLPRLAA